MRRAMALAALVCCLSTGVAAQSRAEIDYMLDLFADLQLESFAKQREYCGFLGRDSDGRLRATDPIPGNRDSCPLVWPNDMDVIASYHTHGTFDFAYYNELPSDTDMLSDQDMDVNGWIATPGGRLWYVDSKQMVAKQICSVGCLPIAPGFYKSQGGEIAKGYTFDELVERLQF